MSLHRNSIRVADFGVPFTFSQSTEEENLEKIRLCALRVLCGRHWKYCACRFDGDASSDGIPPRYDEPRDDEAFAKALADALGFDDDARLLDDEGLAEA
jgi:hypothetical protein